MSNEERYAALVQDFLAKPGVVQDGKGFGSSALKIRGKIFAMLTPGGKFVVKLPRARVDELIASGQGQPFDAGKRRPMKEWLVAGPTLDWEPIAREALAYLAG